MIIRGANVNLTSCIGASDWEYFVDLSEKHNIVKCPRDLVLDFCRENLFIAFIVTDKDKKRLGCVFSNLVFNSHTGENDFTVDLYVDDGNSGYIPECFNLFTDFMGMFTDKIYGYILEGDEKMMKLGKLFGFETVGEAEGYVITVREI